MAKYRKKPIVVEATQWFVNGGHPLDDIRPLNVGETVACTEGKVVRRYRTPDKDGKGICAKCGKTMHEHGWVDTLEGGHIACPGDWIITGVKGEKYPCKPDIFEATYESVSERKVVTKDEFRKELKSLINKHSMENGSDTPDYILASYLSACLEAFDTAVRVREKYYTKEKEDKSHEEDTPG